MMKRPFILFSMLVHLVIFFLLINMEFEVKQVVVPVRTIDIKPVRELPGERLVAPKQEQPQPQQPQPEEPQPEEPQPDPEPEPTPPPGAQAEQAPPPGAASAPEPAPEPQTQPPPQPQPQPDTGAASAPEPPPPEQKPPPKEDGEVPIIVRPFELKPPPPGPTEESDDRPAGAADPDQADDAEPMPVPATETDEAPPPSEYVPEPVAPPADQPEPAAEPGDGGLNQDFIDEANKIHRQDNRLVFPQKVPDSLPPEDNAGLPDLSPRSETVNRILKNFDPPENSRSSESLKAKGIENIDFLGSDSPGLGGDGKTAVGGSAFFNVKGYDITPWARRVVYRIKKNWHVPLAVQAGVKGRVGIYIVFEKNGTISVAHIKDPCKIKAYNQAVVSAFRSSLPFPFLPPDFPNKNLEAFFIFQYN